MSLRKGRMFNRDIVESDAFMSLSDGAKVLYFYLCLNSDDDGFCNCPRKIMTGCGAKDDDMRLLIAKKFVFTFPDIGVAVIKHWRIHNFIRKDRYNETRYKELLHSLYLDENNAYSLHAPETALPPQRDFGIPSGNQTAPTCQPHGIPNDNHMVDTWLPDGIPDGCQTVYQAGDNGLPSGCHLVAPSKDKKEKIIEGKLIEDKKENNNLFIHDSEKNSSEIIEEPSTSVPSRFDEDIITKKQTDYRAAIRNALTLGGEDGEKRAYDYERIANLIGIPGVSVAAIREELNAEKEDHVSA